MEQKVPKMDDVVEFSLNYGGEDYTITSDFATALSVTNDPEEAIKILVANMLIEPPETCARDKSEVVWTAKKPTEMDLQCTEDFLHLRNQLNEKFNDRKTIKTILWNQIATQLIEKGFNLGEKDPGEKCRQKFRNLQTSYMSYVDHMRQTGTGKKEPPPFFDLLHSIFGEKDKANPGHLLDSEKPVETDVGREAYINHPSNEDQEPGTSAETPKAAREKAVGRFARKTQIKPQSNMNILMDTMKEQAQQEQRERNQQFTVITEIMQQQLKQKAEFLKIFKDMAKGTKKTKTFYIIRIRLFTSRKQGKLLPLLPLHCSWNRLL